MLSIESSGALNGLHKTNETGHGKDGTPNEPIVKSSVELRRGRMNVNVQDTKLFKYTFIPQMAREIEFSEAFDLARPKFK